MEEHLTACRRDATSGSALFQWCAANRTLLLMLSESLSHLKRSQTIRSSQRAYTVPAEGSLARQRHSKLPETIVQTNTSFFTSVPVPYQDTTYIPPQYNDIYINFYYVIKKRMRTRVFQWTDAAGELLQQQHDPPNSTIQDDSNVILNRLDEYKMEYIIIVKYDNYVFRPIMGYAITQSTESARVSYIVRNNSNKGF